MMIAILIIQALILLVCCRLIENIQNIQTSNVNQLLNNEKIQSFKHGSVNTWSLINIALFKMWNDSEILDFDSLQGKLSQTVQDLSTDPKTLGEWENKFKSYVQEAKNGDDAID